MAKKRGPPVGNTNGQLGKGNRPFADALRRHACQNPNQLARIAKVHFDAAEQGDVDSFKLIMERLEGKPAQAIKLGGDPDAVPVETNIKLSPGEVYEYLRKK